MSDTLAEALIEAQQKLPAVPKNATAKVPTKSGGEYSYSYVTLDSLIAKTLPVLNDHGIAITQAPEFIEGYGLGLRTTLTHTSGETLTSVMPIPHAGHSMQDIGGAISYARRYAWSALLGIASEHDDDAAAITHTNGSTAAEAEPQFAKPASAPQTGTMAGTDPGDVVLTFGKHKNTAIKDAPRAYLEWWMGQEPPKQEAMKAQRAAVELFLLGVTSEVAQVGGGGEFSDSDVPF